MLGLAAGNALGLPVEGKSALGIRRRFPGGVTEVSPRESDGPWDDDLAQAALLAEALAESDELDPEAFAARLVIWAQRNGRGMGTLTRSVIDELTSGRSSQEAARLAWEKNPMGNSGNGAVMRCPPVALRHLGSGFDLIRGARASALVTHYDARCEWSTVVTAVVTATCLNGEPAPVGAIANAVAAVGGEGWLADSIAQVGEAIQSVEGATLDALELDDPVNMGFTLKTMRVALWCAAQTGGFEETVVAVANEGGDTDTNGAIAGAIMGARHGASSIPRRWLENIANTEDLTRIAERLFVKAGLS
jgi:ADP-ribosyl-[dinitrogen reductase] hydrolase